MFMGKILQFLATSPFQDALATAFACDVSCSFAEVCLDSRPSLYFISLVSHLDELSFHFFSSLLVLAHIL